MNLTDVKIVIEKSVGIPQKYKTQIFEIEKMTFENTYLRCPKSLNEFEKRYHRKNLFLVLCIFKGELIGFRLFDEINTNQVQSMFMVVKENYRDLKISNLICSLSSQYFAFQNYKYITSWTHVDITASKILAKYSSYISTKDSLSPMEIELLNNFELHINKTKGFYGKYRRVPKFYEMLDGRTGDAFFWPHKLCLNKSN